MDAFGDPDQFAIDNAKDGAEKAFEKQPYAKVMAEVMKKFQGEGRGADLLSSKGTAWGLVNAATEYFDHDAGRIQDRRLANAWFGKNKVKKESLIEIALA